MTQPDTRASLVLAFDLILRAHGTAREEAGLAVLRVMRDAGVTCWSDVFPILHLCRDPYDFRLRRVPRATSWPDRVVAIMSARLDDVPAADLAELAILAHGPQSLATSDRTTAIAIPWNERRNIDHQEQMKVNDAIVARLVAQAAEMHATMTRRIP